MSRKLITEFKNKHYYLSNFFPCILYYEGRLYSNVEAAFQAQKTTSTMLKDMFSKCDGLEAKKLAKNLPVDDEFLNKQDNIMRELLKCKFEQNPILMKMFLTLPVDVELVNRNYYWDDYWGVPICKGGLKGQNKLGKLLMELRKEFEEKISYSQNV